MRVAIIGVGNIGRGLAGPLARAGHQVTLSATSSEHAANVAAELGTSAAASNREAVAGADVVILAVPYDADEGLARELGPDVSGKVVVEVSNPVKEDLSGTIPEPSSAAEQLQRWLPEARVVKAFNTTFAGRLANPIAGGAPLDGFVAGDDADAKAAVMSLVEAVGLQPIDAGPLVRARQLEALALLNIALNATNGWDWTSAWRLVR